MSNTVKQHLIDPELCIRCYTCENTCQIQAISHDDNNVVVDFEKCNFCMQCIPVCPTGSIDNWRQVETPYSVDEQLEMTELPLGDQADEHGPEDPADEIGKVLVRAHAGEGGPARPPASASKPTLHRYTVNAPATLSVQGNYRLTDAPDYDVRHIILHAGDLPFPLLEGQSIGILAPGQDQAGRAHFPRLYSISSPRDGERRGMNNFSLTVKREPEGVCSNYLCDLSSSATVQAIGPFGGTFLIPDNPEARLLMICTGTGAAPFRAFTINRQRSAIPPQQPMTLIFGARTPGSLPYFGPLAKVPAKLLESHFAFSRHGPKRHVQDVLLEKQAEIASLLTDPRSHIYLCGLRAMEAGVETAFERIAANQQLQWNHLRDTLREEGRYHVETW